MKNSISQITAILSNEHLLVSPINPFTVDLQDTIKASYVAIYETS